MLADLLAGHRKQADIDAGHTTGVTEPVE